MRPNHANFKPGNFLLRWIILIGAILTFGVQPVYATALGASDGNSGSPLRIYLPAIQSYSSVGTDSQQIQPVTEDSFASQVEDGVSNTVRGVYVQDVLALQVEQQPSDNPAYVAAKTGWATQFEMATPYGVIGLLAHNNLSGELYFNLKPGDTVSVIYGNGKREHYLVTEIDQFQALQPDSVTSSFLNLQTGETLNAGQLFAQVYTGGDHVTFQTCIARNGIASWGRLFVIAQPIAE